MSTKFIPNGDFDFVMMAEHFARTISADPERFAVSAADADALSLAVGNFRMALNAARGNSSRSAVATRTKEDARAAAEKIVRRLAAVIRVNDKIDAGSKIGLGLRERPAKVKQQPVPAEPPRLRFVRALHEGGAMPLHELAFGALHKYRGGRPEGAVRLELFVDLVLPDEAIPAHPGANHGGRPWYLRSYTRSPIVLAPPMTRVPMRVIYWGRWADSSGNVGPFSATAIGWIEGGSAHYLPGGLRMNTPGQAKTELMLENENEPAGRERTISVVVLEAQYQSFHPQGMTAAGLEMSAKVEGEARRIEGRGVEAAA